ncbi:MAG: mechanosensitive ion channel [Candidatus Lokiarchaeota archaeon]|nr:mechanosensitive ion channel [Candidatus Lokiarchaeota archaeon]
MKRIYKIIIWILFGGLFVLVYYYFGFEQLLVNILLLNLVAYVVKSVSIDVFQSLVKNLLVRYIVMLIINIVWLIFPFWLIFELSEIYFVAIISFLVVAISLTFQNVINNIASGVMLLSSGGFEVGDLVEINGIIGIVNEITLNNLKLVDFDGSITYIPNKIAFNSSVVRYTHKPIKKEKKLEISDVVKSLGKIITKEKKLTRYIKVVELLGSIDSEQLEELLKPIFEKYEPIFGIRPYFYANNTVSAITIRLSITIQILTEDPKLILTYMDPFMKEILFKIYEKDINYGWKANEKNNQEIARR